MRASSAFSRSPQAFRAGLELGMGLADLAPEVVFLFSSVHYIDSDDILTGLYEGLGREEVVVIGNSGDGCFASGQFNEFGASALGLNSAGRMRWHVGVAGGVGADPAGTTRRALAAACKDMQGREPALFYLLSDFRTDAAEIERVIEHEVKVPVVGGLALDNSRLERCVLYANHQRLTDHVLVLAVDGPLRFEIHTANTIAAIGNSGVVDAAQGAQLLRIDGVSAHEFIERETGLAFLRSDPGTMPLTVIDEDDPEVRRVRSVIGGYGKVGADDGSLTLYGGIATGKRIQPCRATPQALLQEVGQIAAQVSASGFNPAAALITSCAGRKLLLGRQTEREAGLLAEAFAQPLPLAGFPSAGEIGPVRTSHGYSRNLFHNMACVLLLIGS